MQRARARRRGPRESVDGDRATFAAGLFVGLRYPAGRLADADPPSAKPRGACEQEISDVLLLSSPATFVDVGSADGYYAVGVAVSVSVRPLAPVARAAWALAPRVDAAGRAQ